MCFNYSQIYALKYQLLGRVKTYNEMRLLNKPLLRFIFMQCGSSREKDTLFDESHNSINSPLRINAYSELYANPTRKWVRLQTTA
jgi:hypothetical protein